ncbi:MAG TPA: hypothetical protein VGR11_08470, partial [Solirubrobacteraceae bacterium]|nr:hypothetical protein [Solirubrobacteraceae bacterium]
MSAPRKLLTILVSKSTWRRYAYLLIGAALTAPYGMLGSFLGEAIEGGVGAVVTWVIVVLVCFVALPVVTGMLAPIREIEVAASRRLLGAQLGAVELHHGVPAWSTRWRSAAWFVGHLVIGFAIGALTLVMPPAVLSACYAPFASGDVQLGQLDAIVPGGPQSAWIVPLALLAPVALVLLVTSAGALLARLAPRLL